MKRFIAGALIKLVLLSAPSHVIAQVAAAKSVHSAPASEASAPTPGLDTERLGRIPARMAAFVARGRAAGIVTLVAHQGRVASLNAVGVQDLEQQTPMRTDTIFQVASMTKPVTAVGIMILVEEGLLALTDPVEKHLPQFANIQLAEKKEGKEVESIRRPARKLTIRDLLTHTSGMASGYPPGFGAEALLAGAEGTDLSAATCAMTMLGALSRTSLIRPSAINLFIASPPSCECRDTSRPR